MKKSESNNISSNFAKMLWKEYREEIIVFPVTIITVVTSSWSNQLFTLLDGLALGLLSLYIIYLFYDTYQSTKATTFGANSGYSICLGKHKNFFRDSIRKQIDTLENQKVNLSKIERHFKLIDIDWQYHDENVREPIQWVRSVREISAHFFRYAHRLPINTSLHLFVIAPSPIVLSLGFTIGKHRHWNVYHYANSEYELVPSKSKIEPESNFEYIEIDNNTVEGSEVTVILSFVPVSDIPLPKLTTRVVKITSKLQTKLLSIDQFTNIAIEIVQVLHEFTHAGKPIHLFPGVTLPLAFMIGKLLDENANISIYNPNRQTKTWERVLDLQALDIS